MASRMKVVSASLLLILIFYKADYVGTLMCYVCNQTEVLRYPNCFSDLPNFVLQNCSESATSCYTHITNSFKYSRGCATDDDPIYQMCRHNLFEDCRICDYEKCNNVAINTSMSTMCTQCKEDECKAHVPATSCAHIKVLMTDISKCYYLFEKNGKTVYKGCLDKGVRFTHDYFEYGWYLLTCVGYKCNEISPATSFKCLDVNKNPQDCSQFHKSEFPGCIFSWNKTTNLKPRGCATDMDYNSIRDGILLAPIDQKHGAYCLERENCNRRPNDLKSMCFNRTCISLDDACYYRYLNNSMVGQPFRGCVSEFAIGLYSNLTFFCHNNIENHETTVCWAKHVTHTTHGCHSCSGHYCENVISTVPTRLGCNNPERNCYTYISDDGITHRGCDQSKECLAVPEKCRVCTSNYCNGEPFLEENPLMCPVSEFLKETDPLLATKFLRCEVKTTNALPDRCTIVSDIGEGKNAELFYGCFFDVLYKCRNESVVCEKSVSPNLMPKTFKCIQCRSDKLDELSCADEAQGMKPKLCKYVFAAPLRGCYVKYNPLYRAIERGCASELSGFMYRRCQEDIFPDCVVCNREGCNNMSMQVEVIPFKGKLLN